MLCIDVYVTYSYVAMLESLNRPRLAKSLHMPLFRTPPSPMETPTLKIAPNAFSKGAPRRPLGSGKVPMLLK